MFDHRALIEQVGNKTLTQKNQHLLQGAWHTNHSFSMMFNLHFFTLFSPVSLEVCKVSQKEGEDPNLL